ncbi:hypothetical protein TRVA0_037S00694 [Trichomonascus vanleenenianus]|uniref:uncharacterized protein n=1 Tax=Trichomonascus vanleenenianus TaxID=2268995 RepID=UPI003EC9E15D
MSPYLFRSDESTIGEYRLAMDNANEVNVLSDENSNLRPCFKRVMRRYWRLETVHGQSVAEIHLHHRRRSWITWTNNNGLDWSLVAVKKRCVITSEKFKYFIEADCPRRLSKYKWYLDTMELTKSLILPESKEVVGETRIAEASSANSVKFDYKVACQCDVRDDLFVLVLSFIAASYWERAKSRTKVARYSAMALANSYGKKLVANAQLRRKEVVQRAAGRRLNVRARLTRRCIRTNIIPYALNTGRFRAIHDI